MGRNPDYKFKKNEAKALVKATMDLSKQARFWIDKSNQLRQQGYEEAARRAWTVQFVLGETIRVLEGQAVEIIVDDDGQAQAKRQA